MQRPSQVSSDGKTYWDGSQWASTLSADGKWRWDGHAWTATNPTRSGWGRGVQIGGWVAGGLSLLVALFCVLGLAVSISEATQGDPKAGSTFAGVLIVFSFAVALASPIGIRWANRRGFVVASSIATGLLFLGSCGGGFALAAAYPAPSAEVASRSSNSPTPGSPFAILTVSSPSPSEGVPTPSPSPAALSSQSPSAMPLKAPTPSLKPTLKPAPKPSPKPSPKPVVSICGAPANPWGYNFCGRGGLIYSPHSSFCSYFAPCVSTFWTATSGYVVQCVSGKWSHSGGVSGACSSNGGVARPLYSGP
jgi:hypothetical protein